MLTDFSALEWWIANAKSGSELVFYDFGDNPSRDLHRVANQNAAFAHVWERLKKEGGVYLDMNSAGQCIARKN